MFDRKSQKGRTMSQKALRLRRPETLNLEQLRGKGLQTGRVDGWTGGRVDGWTGDCGQRATVRCLVKGEVWSKVRFGQR